MFALPEEGMLALATQQEKHSIDTMSTQHVSAVALASASLCDALLEEYRDIDRALFYIGSTAEQDSLVARCLQTLTRPCMPLLRADRHQDAALGLHKGQAEDLAVSVSLRTLERYQGADSSRGQQLEGADGGGDTGGGSSAAALNQRLAVFTLLAACGPLKPDQRPGSSGKSVPCASNPHQFHVPQTLINSMCLKPSVPCASNPHQFHVPQTSSMMSVP
jgi:hypothetical protein